MRPLPFLFVVVPFLSQPPGLANGQTPPKLHDINGFIVKGAFKELDPDLMKRRLSLQELKKAGLDGEPTEIENILAWAAKCEKLDSQIEEPAIVQGKIAIDLPPNTMGDEAYTACFYAFSFNGLGLLGRGDDLKLVRFEKHPQLPRSGRMWNRDQILATQLFRLGYLRPDPILRQYRDRIGTGAGHAILEKKSNVLIVADTPPALEALRSSCGRRDPGIDGRARRQGTGRRRRPAPAQPGGHRVCGVDSLLSDGLRAKPFSTGGRPGSSSHPGTIPRRTCG